MREGVILAKGEEKCIAVYTPTEWKRLADSLSAKAINMANRRKLNRALFGPAVSASFDGQGRIILPASLRSHAAIGDIVMVVGVNNRVELWNNELWKAEKASAEEQASQIIESLGVEG